MRLFAYGEINGPRDKVVETLSLNVHVCRCAASAPKGNLIKISVICPCEQASNWIDPRKVSCPSSNTVQLRTKQDIAEQSSPPQQSRGGCASKKNIPVDELRVQLQEMLTRFGVTTCSIQDLDWDNTRAIRDR